MDQKILVTKIPGQKSRDFYLQKILGFLFSKNLQSKKSGDFQNGKIQRLKFYLLIKLKKSGGYTIVAIHHTPKRNRKDPLTRNDLAGSSNLSNLVDCCIGIGKSTYKGDESSRYIKQVKPPRQGKIVYGDSNVITCRIEHIRPNFVGFKRIELNEENAEYKYESNHIKSYSNDLLM